MTATHQFDFLANKANNTLPIIREYAAGLSLALDAFSNFIE